MTSRRKSVPSALLGLFITVPPAACADLVPASHEHQQIITAAPHTYEISLGGTLDHVITRRHQGYALPWLEGFQPNRYLSITNLGRENVENPRVTCEGAGSWYSLADMVDAAVDPGMDPSERALALWSFMMEKVYRVPESFGVRYVDPVVALHTFGFGECLGRATLLGRLAEAAGLTASISGPGHWVSSLTWDGREHFLDADRSTYVLLPSTLELAGEADLMADHHLLRQTHTGWLGQNENLSSDSLYAERFDAARYREALLRPAPRSMACTLRPGETIFRSWQNWGKFSSYEFGSESHGVPPGYFGNGTVTYRPDLADTLFPHGMEELQGLSWFSDDGLRPNLHPAGSARAGSLVLRLASPYVIVGGTVRGDLVRRHEEDRCQLLVSAQGTDWVPVWTAPDTGQYAFEISLDDWVNPHDSPFKFEIWLRVDLFAAHDPTDVGLDSLTAEADFQLAPVFLPSLSLGANHLTYADDSPGERQVLVIHGWDESSATDPPQAPVLLTPEDGSTDVPLRPTLAWEEAADPNGDDIADYEVQVSTRADFRWPVSPCFDRYLSKTPYRGLTHWAPRFDGLLRPGTAYYWRVRARDEQGAWSPWSEERAFTAAGPGRLSCSLVREGKRAFLTWPLSAKGRTPARYRVYGSDVQGFSPGTSSLVAEGADRRCEVMTPAPSLPNQNRAFYRVVAVDSLGVAGAAGSAVELPHPFIFTEPPVRARVGEPYVYAPGIITAVRYDRLPHEDSLAYEAPVLPPWLSLGEDGVLQGTPAPGQEGTWPVNVHVADGHDGETAQTFTVAAEGEEGFTQVVPLPSGCTPVSWFVSNAVEEPAAVLGEILGNMEYAMGFEGGPLYFLTSSPDSSSLDGAGYGRGYWLKMSAAESLRVRGTVRPPADLALPLQEGWNLAPFPGTAADSVAHAFASLGTNLAAVMGCEDVPLAYDPLLPQAGTLQVVRPGHAYWVEVSAADTLVYPNDTASLFEEGTGPAGAGLSSPFWASLHGTAILVEGEPVPAGWPIQVFDPNGVLCGRGETDVPGGFRFLGVAADDPATAEDEGAAPGDSLAVRIGGLELSPSPVYGQFGQRIVASGVLALTSEAARVRILRLGPNPFRDSLAFTLLLACPQAVRVDVFSISGRLVRTVIDRQLASGETALSWDGQDTGGREAASGIYILRVERSGGSITRKVVLAR